MLTPTILNPVKVAATRASTVEAAPETPPDKSALLLDDIVSSIKQNAVNIEINKESTAADVAKSKGLTGIVVQAGKEAAEAAGTIALVEQTAMMKSQQASLAAYGAAAGDPNFQEEIMTRLNTDEQRLEDVLDTNAELGAREFTGVKFLDNLVNNFSINNNKQDVLNATRQLAQTKGEIASVTGATDSFAQINTKLAQTITGSTIEANQKKIAKDAEVGAAKAELASLGANATATTNALNAGQRQTDSLMQLYRMGNEELDRTDRAETRQFRRETQELQLEQHRDGAQARAINLEINKINLKYAEATGEFRIDEYKSDLEEKWRKTALDRDLAPEKQAALRSQYSSAIANAPINTAQAKLRLTATQKQLADEEALDTSYILSVNKAEATAGVPLSTAQEVLGGLNSKVSGIAEKYGELLLAGSGATNEFSDNPYDTQMYLDKVDPNGVADEIKGTKILDQVSARQSAKYVKLGKGVPRDKATQKVDFNNTAKELMDSFEANITTNDSTNPYAAPPMSVIVQSRAVYESAFYKKVISASGKTEFDPQDFVNQGVAAIRAGSVSTEEVADGIVAMVNAAQLFNNTNEGGFARVGLKSQVTYNTTLKRPATLLEALPIVAGGFVLGGASALIGGAFSKEDGKTAKSEATSFLAKKNNRNIKVDLDKYAEVKKLIVLSMTSTPTKPKSEEGTN